MKATLALSTRIGVAILVSLAVVTAAVTAFVVGNPNDALARVSAPSVASSTPSATSSPTGIVDDPHGGAALSYALDYLKSPDSAVDSVWPERALLDLLPNHLYSIDGETPHPLASAIVVGKILSVTGAVAFDGQTGTEGRYDLPGATARVLRISVEVDQALGSASGSRLIDFGMRVEGDTKPETLRAGVAALGRVVVVLNAPGTFGFDSSLYSVRRGSSLLGFVADDGSLSFPALVDHETEFIGTITSTDELYDAASLPAVVGETENGLVSGHEQ